MAGKLVRRLILFTLFDLVLSSSGACRMSVRFDGNVTPAAVYHGRTEEMLIRQGKIKQGAFEIRKQINLSQTSSQKSSLNKIPDLSS